MYVCMYTLFVCICCMYVYIVYVYIHCIYLLCVYMFIYPSTEYKSIMIINSNPLRRNYLLKPDRSPLSSYFTQDVFIFLGIRHQYPVQYVRIDR